MHNKIVGFLSYHIGKLSAVGKGYEMVDENARYNAAGAELASRIQTRETVLMSYIALSATLLTISVAFDNAVLLSLGIPYLAVAASLINAHHDAIIGLLSGYMKDLEVGYSSGTPRWHTDTIYIGAALKARIVRDFAVIVFLLFSTISALMVAKQGIGASPTSLVSGAWGGGVMCILITVLVFLSIYRFHHGKWPFNRE